MERKDFIKKFAIGGSVLFAAPAFLESCAIGDDEIINSEITVDLSSSEFAALGTVGGYSYKDNLIIIRTGSSQYVALSNVCTHQGCTVEYDSSSNLLPCPCHGSIFDISGGVINGPAQQALRKYNTKIDGNTLVIT